MKARSIHGAALAASFLAGSASAQPAQDKAKFQPAIQEARACLHSQAPAAYIASEPGPLDIFGFLKARCYPRFEAKITALGAGDAAVGSFRLIANEEWAAFRAHIGVPPRPF